MITSLQHVAIGIPSMREGIDFFETFGLETHERANHVAMRCFGRAQDQIVLIETGQPRKLHHISIGATAQGLETIRGNLEKVGISLVGAPYEGAPDGLWFHDPAGVLVNIQVADEAPYIVDTEHPKINYPGTVNRSAKRGCPPFDINPRPRRMGHFILFSADVAAARKFYTEVVGFVLSDTIVGDFAAFMRLPADSDHHVMALLASDAPGYHHISFEMPTIDDAEVASTRVLRAGYKHVWGPGRHGVGSNYFHYMRDPWNGMVEYYCDMDYIPGDVTWQPEEWTKKDGMFLWSADGPPPPEFGINYEADQWKK